MPHKSRLPVHILPRRHSSLRNHYLFTESPGQLLWPWLELAQSYSQKSNLVRYQVNYTQRGSQIIWIQGVCCNEALEGSKQEHTFIVYAHFNPVPPSNQTEHPSQKRSVRGKRGHTGHAFNDKDFIFLKNYQRNRP